jgi:hypothetical protein
MKKSILPIVVLITYVFLVLLCAATDGISQKRVSRCHIEEFGAFNALRDIAHKSQVVIGTEAVRPERDATVEFDFQGGTLSDLLNMFISQSPDYSWKEVGGSIIHVFRKDGRVSLTDVVMSYPGAYNKTREEIWEDIAGRPEISAWMNSYHCSRGELFNGKEFRNHNDPISVEARSLTLAQLLDEVAVKSGVNYWAVLQSPPNSPCQIYIKLW